MFDTTMKRIALVLTGLLLSTGAASPAAVAQQVATAATPAAPDAESVRSDEMATMSTEHLERSAEGHVEAARELRPWKHKERADNLWLAAHEYYYAGEKHLALRTFRDAAEAARNAGDPYRAATAYVRAAYLAADRYRADLARAYLQKSEELLAYPEVTERQRASLQVELEELPAYPAIGGYRD